MIVAIHYEINNYDCNTHTDEGKNITSTTRFPYDEISPVKTVRTHWVNPKSTRPCLIHR